MTALSDTKLESLLEKRREGGQSLNSDQPSVSRNSPLRSSPCGGSSCSFTCWSAMLRTAILGREKHAGSEDMPLPPSACEAWHPETQRDALIAGHPRLAAYSGCLP
jgi:hypothetical protein